ncbi:lipopolysaccharide biosynthesis protein [Rheinheimera fenheensis]|uniref:lipopolysaccharide biosynthesis protein n=1 Tax=Rheinheimera fenheensis TaxID=3152295 RepID=UPI00325EE660
MKGIYKNIVAKRDFFKSVATLFTGATIAQLIPLLISPLLTRIYSPEEFGVLAIFVALASMIGVIASGRYEFAVMQASSDKAAKTLVVLSFIVTSIISITLLLAILILDKVSFFNFLDENIRVWLYLVPLSVASVGVFQTLNYWLNRKKNYKSIAVAKVAQSAINVFASLSLFFVTLLPAFGLIFAHVLAQIIGAVFLLKKTGLSKADLQVRRADLVFYAKLFYRFPMVSAPGALLNTAAIQVPVIYVSKFFDLVSAGYFNFVYRIIGGPLSLLSAAISQVFLQKITSGDPKNLYKNVLLAALILFFVCLPVVLIISIWGAEIFGFVFGNQWEVAGELAKILIFSIAVRFVVSPLSMVVAVDRYVTWGAFWQVFTFILVLIFLYLIHGYNFKIFIIAYVIQDLISYLSYFILIISASKKESRRVI